MRLLQQMTRLSVMIIAALTLNASGADKLALDARLEPLRPLLEKTWKAELKGGTPEKPVVDIQRWERALNGKAVRILHSVNEGVYGGESMVLWDGKQQSVVYYYFTTAGFMTTGTMKVQDGKFLTRETVHGNEDGITEVKGTSELKPDGSFHVKTEYLKKGEWVPGRDVVYKEDSSAVVKFQ